MNRRLSQLLSIVGLLALIIALPLRAVVAQDSTGTTTRVSVSSSGDQAPYQASGDPTISADGRYVVFSSSASNFVAGDMNGTGDIFVHDRQTNQTTLVSVSSGGAQGNDDSFDSAISGNGRYVTFASNADNLVAGDTNYDSDIFVHDRQTGQTTLVSTNSGGAQGNNGSCLLYTSPSPRD